MKVLHIIQRYHPTTAGAEICCQAVCRELRKRGCNVCVLTTNLYDELGFCREHELFERQCALGSVDFDEGVRVERFRRNLIHGGWRRLVPGWLREGRFRLMFYGPHSLGMYRQLFRKAPGADIIHLHTLPFPHNLVGWFAGKLFKKPVVCTPYFHAGHPDYERCMWYAFMRLCEAVIVLTHYEKQQLMKRGVPESKITVSNAGVYSEQFLLVSTGSPGKSLLEKHHLREKDKIVLFMGRRTEEKGLQTLIEAVEGLNRDVCVKLVLVGPPAPWFDRFYQKLPESRREAIIDAGFVSEEEKREWLKLASVLVLPSRYESFGMVLLEAWMCGTPVIVSDCGALLEVAEKCGLIFRYGDVSDLRKKIGEALSGEHNTEEMVKEGKRKVIRDYNWEKVGERVYKAYRKVRRGKMKILVVSNLSPPVSKGGSEIVAFQHAELMQRLGHCVHIFCGELNPCSRGYFFSSRSRPVPAMVVDIRPHDLSADFINFDNRIIRRQFLEELEDFAPDIVHFHNLVGMSVRMIDECCMRHIPTVLTLHDYWAICLRNTFLLDGGEICTERGLDCNRCDGGFRQKTQISLSGRNKLVQESFHRIDRFLCPSFFMRDVFLGNGFDAERFSVVRNGLPLHKFNCGVKQPGDIVQFGFIGFLGRHKGVSYLLQAFSKVLENGKEAFLHIAGDGEERELLEYHAEMLGIGKHVRFHGAVEPDRIASMYKKIDVLILPSIWPENSPVTITEAMACRKPVIASNVGGIAELVKHEVSGLLFRRMDSSELASCMESFINSPGRIKAMGEEGFNRVRAWDTSNQVRQVLSEYERLLQ